MKVVGRFLFSFFFLFALDLYNSGVAFVLFGVHQVAPLQVGLQLFQCYATVLPLFCLYHTVIV